MYNSIEYIQYESIINSEYSYDMWDHLHSNYFDQRCGINIHYHYQQLYSRKWNGFLAVSNYIAFYLNICHQFIEAGHCVDNTTIINTLLLSLSCPPTWDVVKQYLLYKGDALTLDDITTKLISVNDWIVQEDIADNIDNKVKTLALVFSQKRSLNKGNIINDRK